MTEFSDDNLIAEFITESRDHLSAIEPDLLLLEQDESQPDPELINRIFRAIHSIKGASGFFGFEGLKKLSHIMENLLMLIRDGEMSPSPAIVEGLLKGVDKLNILLEDIQHSDQVSIEYELNLLTSLLDNKAPAEVEMPIETPAIIPRPIGKAHLYVLEIDTQQDLLDKEQTPDTFLNFLKTIGEVKATTPEIQSGSTLPSQWQIYFSTVLEKDLVVHATSLLESKISIQTEILTSTSNDSTECLPSEPPIHLGSKPPSARAMTRNNGSDSTDSIRVRIDLLNKLMELAGELVLSRNQLLRTIGNEIPQGNGLSNIAQNIDLITSDLQEHIMQTRMQPIGSIFGKFPRIIRDMSKQLGKEINIVLEGEDVELDKSIIESLSDPLTHLIRNCCDHGIELPDDRVRVGKSKTGNILLRAFHQDGQINISISDDGRGIDTEKLIKKALQKALLQEADIKALSPQEQANLIFLPGLSTAEQISDISGRGVGMDVVKTNITKLGGQIQIETSPGEGTSLLLRLPLTLAIIPSLIVGVSSQRFAIPQANLVELVHIRAEEIPERIEKVGTATVLQLRGQLLPLLRLADVLVIPTQANIDDSGILAPERRAEIADIREGIHLLNRRQSSSSGYKIIVVRAGYHQFGLIVDELFDTEEIVVKSLSSFLKDCRCFSGATIMGDGLVAMILDPSGIIAHTALSFETIESERRKLESMNHHLETAQQSESLLIFNNAESEVFAAHLEDILRLEKFQLSEITQVGNREFINYQGKGLPLLRLQDYLPIGTMSEMQKDAYLIIPRAGNGCVGIIVSRILDVQETNCEWKPSAVQAAGIAGWAVLNDQITIKLDIQALLQQAGTTGLIYEVEAA